MGRYQLRFVASYVFPRGTTIPCFHMNGMQQQQRHNSKKVKKHLCQQRSWWKMLYEGYHHNQVLCPRRSAGMLCVHEANRKDSPRYQHGRTAPDMGLVDRSNVMRHNITHASGLRTWRVHWATNVAQSLYSLCNWDLCCAFCGLMHFMVALCGMK